MDSGNDIDPQILTRVRRLQNEVSQQAGEMAQRLGSFLVCQQGCHECCVDDLAVFPVEAEIIRQHCGPLLTFDQPHPKGKCAFLDAHGACRIYPWRPYVCRTQGLPLQWLDVNDSGAEVELRDICPLNLTEMEKQKTELKDLPADDCWVLGEVEGTLAGLQVQALGGFQELLPRVMLRDLFNRPT